MHAHASSLQQLLLVIRGFLRAPRQQLLPSNAALHLLHCRGIKNNFKNTRVTERLNVSPDSANMRADEKWAIGQLIIDLLQMGENRYCKAKCCVKQIIK